jgi:hypothetical protein
VLIGANVNSSSPIIGTPLHVVCSEGIENRVELLTMLLSSGADPSLIVESDDGPPLRPVLSEYLSTNENPCPLVINLLLKYGAKVR